MHVHRDIDRNVFYPALNAAGGGYAARRSRGSPQLEQGRDKIEHAGPPEHAFFAKILLLGELFRELVVTDQNPREVFAEGRQSSVDLDLLATEQERCKARLRIPSAPPSLRQGMLGA